MRGSFLLAKVYYRCIAVAVGVKSAVVSFVSPQELDESHFLERQWDDPPVETSHTSMSSEAVCSSSLYNLSTSKDFVQHAPIE